ncbi:MAG: hypothetical protein PHV42_00360 [Candidatus Pacebacteria bacterium]|nr:hypothetical protein [Candidatus Paceibacterota bacterium]
MNSQIPYLVFILVSSVLGFIINHRAYKKQYENLSDIEKQQYDENPQFSLASLKMRNKIRFTAMITIGPALVIGLMIIFWFGPKGLIPSLFIMSVGAFIVPSFASKMPTTIYQDSPSVSIGDKNQANLLPDGPKISPIIGWGVSLFFLGALLLATIYGITHING